jgi:hypothetical protein
MEKAVGPTHPQVLLIFYNLACMSARVGDRERALGYLERSVERGETNPDLLTDPDLEPLRGEPRFQALAERVRAAQPARPSR